MQHDSIHTQSHQGNANNPQTRYRYQPSLPSVGKYSAQSSKGETGFFTVISKPIAAPLVSHNSFGNADMTPITCQQSPPSSHSPSKWNRPMGQRTPLIPPPLPPPNSEFQFKRRNGDPESLPNLIHKNNVSIC